MVDLLFHMMNNFKKGEKIMKKITIKQLIIKEVNFLKMNRAYYLHKRGNQSNQKMKIQSNRVITPNLNNYIMLCQISKDNLKHYSTSPLYSDVKEVEIENSIESSSTNMRKYYTLNFPGQEYHKRVM